MRVPAPAHGRDPGDVSPPLSRMPANRPHRPGATLGQAEGGKA